MPGGNAIIDTARGNRVGRGSKVSNDAGYMSALLYLSNLYLPDSRPAYQYYLSPDTPLPEISRGATIEATQIYFMQ